MQEFINDGNLRVFICKDNHEWFGEDSGYMYCEICNSFSICERLATKQERETGKIDKRK